jgi:hypothetical protein
VFSRAGQPLPPGYQSVAPNKARRKNFPPWLRASEISNLFPQSPSLYIGGHYHCPRAGSVCDLDFYLSRRGEERRVHFEMFGCFEE